MSIVVAVVVYSSPVDGSKESFGGDPECGEFD